MKPWMKYGAVGLVAFLVGVGAGATGSEEGDATEPEVRVETVTEEVEVERTPQACLDALDHAEEGFRLAAEFASISSQAFTLAGEAMQAIASLDVAAVERATEQLLEKQAEIEALNELFGGVADPWNRTKQECRDSA